MTKRRSAECIGCAPPGLRSMMASRRWPSTAPPSASTQTSPASGPRCRTVSIMASPIERNASADVAARQSIMPAMPHIARIPGPAGRNVLYRLIREASRRLAFCRLGIRPLRLERNARLVAGMKILLFIRDLSVGGSQRQLAVLANGLARRGHDVAVVVLYAGGALEALLDESGVRLISIGKVGRWDVITPLARLRRLFISEHPDLVYAFLPTQTTLAALLLPQRLKTKLVFGLRAGGMQLDHYDALSALTYRSEAWLSRRADLAIAN